MRYQSFAEFWPFYIHEHADPRNRRVHFVGTSSFFVVLAACLWRAPVAFSITAIIVFSIGWAAFSMEARRNAAPVLLIMLAMCIVVDPLFTIAPVIAYGCAWYGHFRIEFNRPATFTYPLWSLAGDFRMYGNMLRGRLWSGDGSDVAGPVLEPGALLHAGD